MDFARQYPLEVQATVTKPGHIDGPNREGATSAMFKGLVSKFGHAHAVHVSEHAAAMIDQCLNGITKDPLRSNDLVEIGQRVLRDEDYLR